MAKTTGASQYFFTKRTQFILQFPALFWVRPKFNHENLCASAFPKPGVEACPEPCRMGALVIKRSDADPFDSLHFGSMQRWIGLHRFARAYTTMRLRESVLRVQCGFCFSETWCLGPLVVKSSPSGSLPWSSRPAQFSATLDCVLPAGLRALFNIRPPCNIFHPRGRGRCCYAD